MVFAMAYEEYTNEELLIEYKKCGEHKMKQELVLRYSYLVRAIAMQMRGIYLNFTEVDDIINEGIIALMGAIDKFDISRNVKLETYASLRIRGTIVDLARKQDWIPRSVRKKAKEIDKAAMQLYEENGAMPDDAQVAARMKMPMDKYYKTVNATSLYNVISLDSVVTEFQDNFNVMPVSGQDDPEGLPDYFLQRKELSRVLAAAIENLGEREKLVISLYYRRELSMKEIAGILEVSEPRVSQLHSSAIRKLRIALQAYIN